MIDLTQIDSPQLLAVLRKAVILGVRLLDARTVTDGILGFFGILFPGAVSCLLLHSRRWRGARERKRTGGLLWQKLLLLLFRQGGRK